MIFEDILALLPYILDFKIVTQTIENDNLIEKSYSRSSINSKGIYPTSYEDRKLTASIHILVEKIFKTCNFYLLVPYDHKMGNVAFQTQQSKSLTQRSETIYGLENWDQANDFLNSKTTGFTRTDSPVKNHMCNTVSNGFYSPKIERENLKLESFSSSTTENERRKREQELTSTIPNFEKTLNSLVTLSCSKNPGSSLESFKDTMNYEKKRQYSELWSGVQSSNKNASIEKGSFRVAAEPESPITQNRVEFKEKFNSTKISERKFTLPVKGDIYAPPAFAKGSVHTDRADLFIKQPEFIRALDFSQDCYTEPQNGYVLKSKIKPAFTAQTPYSDRFHSIHSKTNSFSYSGNHFGSEAFEKNILTFNQSYQNYAGSNNYLVDALETSTFNSNATVSTATTASDIINNYGMTNPNGDSPTKGTFHTNQKVYTKLETDGNYSTKQSNQLVHDRAKDLASCYTSGGIFANSSPNLNFKTASSLASATSGSQEKVSFTKDYQNCKYNRAANIPSPDEACKMNTGSKISNGSTTISVSPQKITGRSSYDEKKTHNILQKNFASRFSLNTAVKNS